MAVFTFSNFVCLFSNTYSYITSVRYDAYAVENKAGKERRAIQAARVNSTFIAVTRLKCWTSYGTISAHLHLSRWKDRNLGNRANSLFHMNPTLKILEIKESNKTRSWKPGQLGQPGSCKEALILTPLHQYIKSSYSIGFTKLTGLQSYPNIKVFLAQVCTSCSNKSSFLVIHLLTCCLRHFGGYLPTRKGMNKHRFNDHIYSIPLVRAKKANKRNGPLLRDISQEWDFFANFQNELVIIRF